MYGGTEIERQAKQLTNALEAGHHLRFFSSISMMRLSCPIS